MDEFDIGRLTDFDFEVVCRDIFELTLGLKLEIFSSGRDGGVDLRHMKSIESTTGNLIIQCKHWERSKFSTLYSYMKNKELPKIVRLAPERYILATSVNMSVQQKDKILKLLTPYVKSSEDIYNVSEIENLLRRNPQIVKRHMRLWLSSAATLQAMLSKNILIRSGDLADEVKSTMLVYVPNDSFNRAEELLNEQRVCIIAGVPGIGKTTLAQILTVSYAEIGYDIFEISEDVDEINDVWDDNALQFFYYDDFLGQTSLEDRLHKNEDSRLVKIINRINKFPNKRFVLTTREYILAQARRKYERLAGENFNPLTCVLSLADYTPLIRAEILYNHLYFSELGREEKARFADRDVYMPIISHRNFNPRLIDYSLRLSFGSNEESAKNAAHTMIENLNNPRRIWEHIIDNQLDQDSIAIVIALFSFRREASLDDLELAVQSYLAQGGSTSTHQRFLQSLKVLDNTMVRIGSDSGDPIVFYHSPSIRDYISRYLAENPDRLRALIRSVTEFGQLEGIVNQGASDNQSPLHLKLNQAGEDIEAAVGRTMTRRDSESNRFAGWTDDIIEQAADIIGISNMLRAEKLADLVADVLVELDFYEAFPDQNVMVLLLKRLWGSDFQRLIDIRSSLLDSAMEYFFEDVSDWGNADHTRSLLEELGDIAPQSSKEAIDEVLFRRTEEALEWFANNDDSPPYDMRNLEQIVNYARAYGSPDETFPGYREAASVVATQQANREDIEAPRRSAPAEVGTTVYTEIHQMFGSLAESKFSDE
jgi:hypothetical protein